MINKLKTITITYSYEADDDVEFGEVPAVDDEDVPPLPEEVLLLLLFGL